MSYPLKLKYAGSKKLSIHFQSAETLQKVLMMILNEQGFDSQIDQYELVTNNYLNESDDQLIIRAHHIRTGVKVAFKVILKTES